MPASMSKVWPTMEFLHVNTVEAPVYWERLEPKPGEFDYSLVDMLLQQAREHHVRLVLLWFGTWKNGSVITLRTGSRSITRSIPEL
jgi:beta-galactosidase GanA